MSAIYIYMYLTFQDLDAIAVTTEPGLAPCLGIGLGYAKELVAESGCVVNKFLIYGYLISVKCCEHHEMGYVYTVKS